MPTRLYVVVHDPRAKTLYYALLMGNKNNRCCVDQVRKPDDLTANVFEENRVCDEKNPDIERTRKNLYLMQRKKRWPDLDVLRVFHQPHPDRLREVEVLVLFGLLLEGFLHGRRKELGFEPQRVQPPHRAVARLRFLQREIREVGQAGLVPGEIVHCAGPKLRAISLMNIRARIILSGNKRVSKQDLSGNKWTYL